MISLFAVNRADWDNDSYLEDEYVPDEEDAPSPSLLSAVSQFSVKDLGGKGISGVPRELLQEMQKEPEPIVNERWSEEAPYFDEADVQDDEGNWGRSTGTPSIGTSGSTRWMSRSEYAEVAEAQGPPSQPVSNSVPAAVTSSVTVAVTPTPSAVEKDLQPALTPVRVNSDAASDLQKQLADLRVNLALTQGFIAGIFLAYIVMGNRY